MKRLERAERLLEYMSAEQLLEELLRAMGEDDAHDNLDYIVRMWDIEEDEEEE